MQGWDDEHIFYNPLFLEGEDTIPLTQYCEKNKIYRYKQLLQEKDKEQRHLPYNKALTNLLRKIQVNTSIRTEDILITGDYKEIIFKEVTHKIIYEEALLKNYRNHHSQEKWIEKLDTSINWNDVWNTVHNILSSNKTVTHIWQQIHQNFYTQYS